MTTLHMDADAMWRTLHPNYIDAYGEWLKAQGADPQLVKSVEHGEGVIITTEYIRHEDGEGIVIEWPSGNARTHRVTRAVDSLPPLPTSEDYR